MADFVFRISPNIVLGSYSSSRTGQFVREWGSRFLLVADPVLSEFGITEKTVQSLKDYNIDCVIFDEISSNSDTALTEQALKLARDAHVHGRSVYMNKIAPIHPGEILSEDFLKPMGISGYKLAKALLIDQTRVSEIIKGKRSITIDTALRLAKFFGTTPEFWLNIQAQYDIETLNAALKEDLNNIHTYVYEAVEV